MVDMYVSDAWCACCGRIHKIGIDLDKPPPKTFRYYTVLCDDCRGIPVAVRDRIMRRLAQAAEGRLPGIGRGR